MQVALTLGAILPKKKEPESAINGFQGWWWIILNGHWTDSDIFT